MKGKKHSKTSGTDFAFEVIPDSDLKVDFNPTTGDFRIEPLVFYDIGKIVELHVYLEDAT